MKKFFIFLLLCFFVSCYCSAEDYTSFSVDGTMGGGKIHFKLSLCYEESGLVWGQTTYYRQNGSVSNIQVYGTQSAQYVDICSFDRRISFDLNEYDKNFKICGHFSISMNERIGELNIHPGGKWFFNGKKFNFDQVKIYEETHSFSKPDADDFFQKGIVLNLVRKESHSYALIDNGESRITYNLYREFPYLLSSPCADSVQAYINQQSRFAHTVSDYIDQGECAEEIDSLSVFSEGRNYVTLQTFDYEEWSGMPHPAYYERYVTFIKNDGSIISKKDLFVDPTSSKLIDTIFKDEETIPDQDRWMSYYDVAIIGDSILINEMSPVFSIKLNIHYSKLLNYLTPWAKVLFQNQHSTCPLKAEEKK